MELQLGGGERLNRAGVPETRSSHRLGAKSGKCAPRRVPSKGTTALCAFGIPDWLVLTVSALHASGLRSKWERQRRSFQLLAASEEREEPMAESPTDRELLLGNTLATRANRGSSRNPGLQVADWGPRPLACPAR